MSRISRPVHRIDYDDVFLGTGNHPYRKLVYFDDHLIYRSVTTPNLGGVMWRHELTTRYGEGHETTEQSLTKLKAYGTAAAPPIFSLKCSSSLERLRYEYHDLFATAATTTPGEGSTNGRDFSSPPRPSPTGSVLPVPLPLHPYGGDEQVPRVSRDLGGCHARLSQRFSRYLFAAAVLVVAAAAAAAAALDVRGPRLHDGT